MKYSLRIYRIYFINIISLFYFLDLKKFIGYFRLSMSWNFFIFFHYQFTLCICLTTSIFS